MVMRRTAFSTAVLAAMLGFAVSANAASPLAYCRADVARLCPGVQPGGGAIKNCLKEHENEVSIGCGKELKKLKAQMGK